MENPISSSSAAAGGQDNNNQPPQLRCPRCDSSNTKFCYYNNYSLSQPRHFCKSCKRYWTRGGTLRNVPVGGGCRKNHKRPNNSTSAANKRLPLPLPSSSSSATSTLVLESPNHHNNQINNPLLYGLQHYPAPEASSHHPHHLVSSFSSNGLGYSGISPSMATLLASTLNNKFSSSSTSSNGIVKPDHYSAGFEGLQMGIHGGVKAHYQEQGQDWNINNFGNNQNNLGWGQVLMNDHHHHHNQVVEGVGSGQEPGYWTGLWSDPGSNNIGPSVTSLI